MFYNGFLAELSPTQDVDQECRKHREAAAGVNVFIYNLHCTLTVLMLKIIDASKDELGME